MNISCLRSPTSVGRLSQLIKHCRLITRCDISLLKLLAERMKPVFFRVVIGISVVFGMYLGLGWYFL